MPTTRPRYTVTDTGDVSEMLDLARRVWPEVTDRKQLLLRLGGRRPGHDPPAARLEGDRLDAAARRTDRAPCNRAATLMDLDLLLADAAWQ